MYFGKSAVTFTIPGNGVIYVNIDGVTGIECPNRDVKAFAEALMRLKNDSELLDKISSARQRVLNKFLYTTFKNSIINLIERLR